MFIEKNRSTVDLIFALRQTVEKIGEYDQKSNISFIDLRKVFDSIPREKPRRVLGEQYQTSAKLRKVQIE